MKPYKIHGEAEIPKGWDFVSLGTLLTEFRGGAPLKPSDFTSAGIKVIPKGGVSRSGWLQVEDVDWQYCSPSFAESHKTNQIDESFTIVVLRDLVPSGPSIGLIVQIKNREIFVLAQGVYGFKVNDNVIPEYLVQLSNTQWYRKLMNSIMVGSTQVHITNTAFKLAHIPLPKVTEQTAIATALSDTDALITSLEKLIVKKRNIKQGGIQQLLTGRKRLYGFDISDGKFLGYKNTEVGIIPKDWEIKTIGEIFEFEGGSQPAKHLFSFTPQNGYIRLLQIRDYKSNVFETYIPKLLARRFCTETDIMIGRYGPPIFQILRGKSGAYNVALIKAIPTNTVNKNYAWYILNQNSLFLFVEKLSQRSSGQTGVDLDALKRYQIPFPLSINEQVAIAQVISDMDAEIEQLEQKLYKYKLIKQGMMQELLTGKTRLV